MVILITYGMMYFTMEAVFVVCILAMKLASVHMCEPFACKKRCTKEKMFTFAFSSNFVTHSSFYPELCVLD